VRWVKSTKSTSGACVEVARDGDEILVRNSRDPAGPVLRVSREAWDAFRQGVADGEFD
jgi:predicted secreted Zn-dependent protease